MSKAHTKRIMKRRSTKSIYLLRLRFGITEFLSFTNISFPSKYFYPFDYIPIPPVKLPFKNQILPSRNLYEDGPYIPVNSPSSPILLDPFPTNHIFPVPMNPFLPKIRPRF